MRSKIVIKTDFARKCRVMVSIQGFSGRIQTGSSIQREYSRCCLRDFSKRTITSYTDTRHSCCLAVSKATRSQRREQTMISPQDLDELQQLEESLWIAHTRFDRVYMEQILSPEFVEFGRSGKVYGREETLSASYHDIHCTFPLKHFTAHHIVANVFLVTYVSETINEGDVFIANRSSIWIKSPQGWQLRFHQGTPVKP